MHFGKIMVGKIINAMLLLRYPHRKVVHGGAGLGDDEWWYAGKVPELRKCSVDTPWFDGRVVALEGIGKTRTDRRTCTVAISNVGKVPRRRISISVL